MQQYKIDILLNVSDGSVKSDCADITFFNQGNTKILLNSSVTINAGQSLSLTANANEIDRTIYNYYFITTGVGTPNNKLVIFRKIYV